MNSLTPSRIKLKNISEYLKNNVYVNSDLQQLSTQCYERYQKLPWPKQSDEEWRRTDIGSYPIDEFAIDVGDSNSTHLLYNHTATILCCSLTDIFDETQTDIAGANINTIRAVLIELLQSRMKCATHKIEIIPLLFLRTVYIAYVSEGSTASNQIELIINDKDSTNNGMSLTPFLGVIVVEKGVEAEITVRYCSPPEDEHAIISDMLCLIHDNARCQVTTISDINMDSMHIANGMALIGKDSTLRVGTAVVNGMLSKHRFDVYLDGEGSEAYLDGCYIGHEDQHIDVRTQQIHRAPSTNSFALYRGIATDEAHIIYQGLIEVQENASKTDAYLTNNNILLNDEARSDSIPSLNIKTDDVKCSHGSTTGTVDEFQLFYLQTRGINKDEAVRLIVEGFLGEVVDRYPQSVRDALIQRFAEQLV